MPYGCAGLSLLKTLNKLLNGQSTLKNRAVCWYPYHNRLSQVPCHEFRCQECDALSFTRLLFANFSQEGSSFQISGNTNP